MSSGADDPAPDSPADLPMVDLRPPGTVMRLDRMGASFPTRLSFGRALIRDLAKPETTFSRARWEMDDEGFGRAVYQVDLDGRAYSLVAFSTRLDPDQRTDRVIATAWDTSFVLFDGVPDQADLDRLQGHVPRQEAGTYHPTELTLSRANRSVRLFDHVVERLAEGRQPDMDRLLGIGYLMRTTAVYGNGKFGIADRARVVDRPGMDGPFRIEMLTVWLIRAFTLDLADHMARCRSPKTAVPLDRRLRRCLGVGNATGLGMAPFVINHPVLVNNWAMARETALARVRAVAAVDDADLDRVRSLVDRAQHHVAGWRVDDDEQQGRIDVLADELVDLEQALGSWSTGDRPWDRLVDWSASRSLETQELVVALVLEVNGHLIDGLTHCMSTAGDHRFDPTMMVGRLRQLIDSEWLWALAIDFEDRVETDLFWYVSEENLEPRLGRRYHEPGAELEEPLDIARRVKGLAADLDGVDPERSVASFMADHPNHRMAAARVQIGADHPYSEVRDNLLGIGCRPIDLLRWKLAFFGASRFDPKSDRWTRITLFQGAPLPDELDGDDADDWWLPAPGSPAEVGRS